jgi:hypothetical protein
MSKKLVLVLVLSGIVVISGISALILIKKNDNKSSGTNSQSITSDTQMATTDQGSVIAQMAKNKAQECTVKFANTASVGDGKFYSDGNLHGRFDISLSRTNPASVVDGHLIFKDNKVYSWFDTPNGTYGVVYNGAVSNNSQSSNSSVDPNANYTFTCKSWKVDTNKFDQPESVTFLDPQNPTGLNQ